jgi:hypothetical protein
LTRILAGRHITTKSLTFQGRGWIERFIRCVSYNIPITPSPGRDRGNGLETQPGIESPKQGDVILNLPALAVVLTIHGGEEVRCDGGMAAGEPWDMIWFLESLEKSEHKKKKKKGSRAMGGGRNARNMVRMRR